MTKAVLFDLDGTLLDTSNGIRESVKYTIDRLGLPELSESTILKFVGPPIQDSLMQYCGLSSKSAQQGAQIFRDYYKNEALYQASLYPGVYPTLLELKNSGIKIGVATYKREDYAIKLLDYFGIAEICDVIHGADNENKLNKAAIIEKCIAELGADKSETVLIGDTEHDAKGAMEAGVGFIAVTWGFGYKNEKEMENYPVKAVVNSPKDIFVKL